MTATKTKTNLRPTNQQHPSLLEWAVAAAVLVVLAAAVLAGFWWANKGDAPEPEPHAAVMAELQQRGFSYMTHEGTTETGAERFYANLGDCRVRVQFADGIYAVMVNDYRVVDPTEVLLREDPVFAKCFADATESGE